eukprot:scaffold7637_cov430-Prasinococcus_capsulatus_cf.AAC.9
MPRRRAACSAAGGETEAGRVAPAGRAMNPCEYSCDSNGLSSRFWAHASVADTDGDNNPNKPGLGPSGVEGLAAGDLSSFRVGTSAQKAHRSTTALSLVTRGHPSPPAVDRHAAAPPAVHAWCLNGTLATLAR